MEREGRYQEIISLPGIFFFDGWRVQPSLTIPANVPQTQDVPDRGTPRAKAAEDKDGTRQPEDEARDILAAAYKNQAENGPNTRRAAIRACKYLKVLVERHGKIIHQVHMAAREHTQQSKLATANKQQHQPAGGTLPKITPELTSELLHCLTAIPDPCVKLCTAKLCLENQNKTYRDQSYPKAFPLLNKRESNFPCSLAQITPDNKATLQHTLCFSRSGLSQRRSLGIQFKYCSKVTKTKEGFLSKLQTGFQS